MTKPILPQLADVPFLMDGGAETYFIFHEGIDLPHFALFDVLKDEPGRETLRRYHRAYIDLALRNGVGLVLDSPTWRASSDWGPKIGYSLEELEAFNRDSIGMLHELREAFETPGTPMVISGCIGPRGDGYQPDATMTADEAANYHREQIRTLRNAGADFVTAYTITTVEEALGMIEAAGELETPIAISFTLETDGKLPTGQTLQEAIETVDARATVPAAYFLINCAHPTHFADALPEGAAWVKRLRGLRANASCRSHAELDESTDLAAGNPIELGAQYRELRERHPNFTILGGCCGTDLRHIEAISEACLSLVVA